MKKLTAGIFTALLGLVTVNAANAAIPSTSYVDTKIGAAETAAKKYADDQDAVLKSGYKAADAALGTRIDGVVTDYQQADTELDGKITANTNEINGLKTSKQDALSAGSGLEILSKDGVLTIQTKGIATSESLTDLQGRMTTAEGEIDTLQSEMEAVEGKAGANETAIATLNGDETVEGSVAKAEADAKAYAESLAVNYDEAGAAAEALTAAQTYADGLNTAADGRLDALEAKDVTLNTAIETNKAAIESNDSDIAGLKDKDTELAGLISDNATEIAKKADATETTQALATKVAKEGHAASQVVITDPTGAIATAAQIPNTQVSGLGTLATKSTVVNADVAADAAIEQSKIAGLTDALNGKMPVRAIATDTISEAGTYVLTATQENGVINYTWELIDRQTTGGEA